MGNECDFGRRKSNYAFNSWIHSKYTVLSAKKEGDI